MQASMLANMQSELTGIRSQAQELALSNKAASQDTGTSGTSGTSGSTSSANSGSTITSDDFLQLLVAEMKNQDPTANTDPNEYINQLVQVNSLQQLISINQDLTPTTSSSATTGTGTGSGTNGSTDAAASNGAIGGLASAVEANFENAALANSSTDGSSASKHASSFAAQHKMTYGTVSSDATMGASAAHIASALAPEGSTLGQGAFPLRSANIASQAGTLTRP